MTVRTVPSKTIVIAESREEEYSAWPSGVSTTLTMLPPEATTCRDISVRNGNDGQMTVKEGLPGGLNYGRRHNATREDPAARWWEKRTDKRHWGPSSAHSGDVVMCGYADGHVKALNSGISATIQYRLVTRGGGESADDG